MTSESPKAPPPVPPSNEAKSQLISRLSALNLASPKEGLNAVSGYFDPGAKPQSSSPSCGLESLQGSYDSLIHPEPPNAAALESWIDNLTHEVTLLRHQVRASGRLSILVEPPLGDSESSLLSVRDSEACSADREVSDAVNICAYCGRFLEEATTVVTSAQHTSDEKGGGSGITDVLEEQSCCDLCAELLLNVTVDRTAFSISDSASLYYAESITSPTSVNTDQPPISIIPSAKDDPSGHQPTSPSGSPQRPRAGSLCMVCGVCEASIDPQTEYVTVGGRKFHLPHFQCEHCRHPLVPTGYLVHNDKYYCPQDYRTLFSSQCRRCQQTITDEIVTALGGSTWHPSCFVCTTCHEPFRNDTYYEWHSRPYCEYHWHAVRGSICSACNAPIIGHYVSIQGKVYHSEHRPVVSTSAKVPIC
ncbi:hypothetical protein IWQ61_009576 [Dispira simplex]|nr:hypothetical protein IWQ61_009576 [Dispira simplex]